VACYASRYELVVLHYPRACSKLGDEVETYQGFWLGVVVIRMVVVLVIVAVIAF
jgi:hypothetical protein